MLSYWHIADYASLQISGFGMVIAVGADIWVCLWCFHPWFLFPLLSYGQNDPWLSRDLCSIWGLDFWWIGWSLVEQGFLTQLGAGKGWLGGCRTRNTIVSHQESESRRVWLKGILPGLLAVYMVSGIAGSPKHLFITERSSNGTGKESGVFNIPH